MLADVETPQQKTQIPYGNDNQRGNGKSNCNRSGKRRSRSLHYA